MTVFYKPILLFSNITIKDSLDMSQDEQIASWNFNALDSNKNKVGFAEQFFFRQDSYLM